jgi:phage tail-like protein
MNANSLPHPYMTFNFAVEIKVDPVSKRVCDAAFSECDGLEMTMEVKTIREGGVNDRQYRLTGPVAYGQLTLKRGMTGNWDLWNWFRQVSLDPALRADAEVVVFGKDRQDPVMSFLLTRCVPIKLKAPALNAAAGGVAIEELQLAYETLELKEKGTPNGDPM